MLAFPRRIRFIFSMDMVHTAIPFPPAPPPPAAARRLSHRRRLSGWLPPAPALIPMMMALTLALTFMALPLPARAADGAKPPEFRQVPPLPGVREAARAAGLQLEGFAPARAGKLRAGDAATALVTWTSGTRNRQWIIELEADALTKEESRETEESVRYHTSTGNQFTLGGGRAALKLRVAGPLEGKAAADKGPAAAPRLQERRILISPDHLALGLDRMPALLMRINAASKTHPKAVGDFNLGFAPKPYPPAEVAEARRRMAQSAAAGVGVDKADERGFVGAFVAMQEFFMVADSTPGIQEVLRSVVDIPWWSIISRGGKANIHFTMLPQMRELDAAPWGLPAADKIYALPFQLEINEKPALVLQLAVTRPRPPLTVCAGAVGFAAGPVSGKGPVLTFQIVSTRTARPPRGNAPAAGGN